VWISKPNCNSSVFDLSPLANQDWGTNQRIHQYYSGLRGACAEHNERWGNVTFTIDNDAEDGPVAGVASNTPSLSTIYLFTGSVGGDSQGGLVVSATGQIFGTTPNYGQYGSGTAFQLTPPVSSGTHWTPTLLHSFKGGSDGGVPYSTLTFGPPYDGAIPAGGLYGTTTIGGDLSCGPSGGGCGTLFQLNPPTWTVSTLYRFHSRDKIYGGAPLTLGPQGILYSTDYTAGENNSGAVFQLVPPATAGASWKATIIHSFKDDGDGGFPFTGVMLAPDGSLYGTTTLGGDFSCFNGLGCGTVFQLTPPAIPSGTWELKTIYAFNGIDGEFASSVILGPNGSLYGTTQNGGGTSCFYIGVPPPQGCGTVFQLTPPVVPGDAWTLTPLHSFQGGSDGEFPSGGVVLGPNGSLYGTTYAGGNPCPQNNEGCGTVFQLTPPATPGGAWSESVLYRFTAVQDRHKSDDPCCKRGLCVPGTGVLRLRSAAVS
jgi:uncharacterized repeat protein (TIGR03803 family)